MTTELLCNSGLVTSSIMTSPCAVLGHGRRSVKRVTKHRLKFRFSALKITCGVAIVLLQVSPLKSIFNSQDSSLDRWTIGRRNVPLLFSSTPLGNYRSSIDATFLSTVTMFLLLPLVTEVEQSCLAGSQCQPKMSFFCRKTDGKYELLCDVPFQRPVLRRFIETIVLKPPTSLPLGKCMNYYDGDDNSLYRACLLERFFKRQQRHGYMICLLVSPSCTHLQLVAVSVALTATMF